MELCLLLLASILDSSIWYLWWWSDTAQEQSQRFLPPVSKEEVRERVRRRVPRGTAYMDIQRVDRVGLSSQYSCGNSTGSLFSSTGGSSWLLIWGTGLLAVAGSEATRQEFHRFHPTSLLTFLTANTDYVSSTKIMQGNLLKMLYGIFSDYRLRDKRPTLAKN